MRKFIHIAALASITTLLGCISIPVTSTVVSEPGKRVTAEQKKFSFLWLSPLPLETASLLLDDILRQCDGADLTGVTVGTQTAFAVVGQVEKVIVSGYCVDGS